MDHYWLAVAIPFFLLLMGLEYILTTRNGKRYFQFNDSVANLSVGIAERLLDLFTISFFYGFYNYLHQHYALWSIQPSVWAWLFLFIATDFVWYWYHRLAHEVNLFWAAHVVHHQSDEFNYTVSARITVFQAVVRAGFWSVLPVIGFPAEMITALLLVHGLYPFFIHTRAIGKLGWLEYVLVTPSHHRVHHASNPQYLDKNYGDVLIIWDKLFGTFTPETDEPVYGLTKPLGSYSFLWQHFHFLLELIETARRTPGFWPKVRLLFGRPDHVDGQVREKLAMRFLANSVQTDSSTGKAMFRRYVVGQMAVVLGMLFVLLWTAPEVSGLWQGLTALFILLTLINCGAILEQRQWISPPRTGSACRRMGHAIRGYRHSDADRGGLHRRLVLVGVSVTYPALLLRFPLRPRPVTNSVNNEASPNLFTSVSTRYIYENQYTSGFIKCWLSAGTVAQNIA